MNDWAKFFDTFARQYDGEIFTKNTEVELRFLVEQLKLKPEQRVLDVGCGTGRHAVGLAVAGLEVTGVDISSGMLTVARERAESAGVSVEFVHSNAADFVRPDAFDVVVCLCEGAMCLYAGEDDPLDRDMKLLSNIHASLRAGGRFLLNVLNACRAIRRFTDEDVASGQFDMVNLTEVSEAPALLGEDGSEMGTMRERGYTAPEIRRMLSWTGFEVKGVYGGTAGNWGLRPAKLDEYELMIFANKP